MLDQLDHDLEVYSETTKMNLSLEGNFHQFSSREKISKEFKRWRATGTLCHMPIASIARNLASFLQNVSLVRAQICSSSEGDCRDMPRLRLCFNPCSPISFKFIWQSYTTVRRSLVAAERKQHCRTKAAKIGKPESFKRAFANQKGKRKAQDGKGWI